MMRFGNIPAPKPKRSSAAKPTTDNTSAATETSSTNDRTRSPRISTKPPLPEQARAPSSVPAPAPAPAPRRVSPDQRENIQPPQQQNAPVQFTRSKCTPTTSSSSRPQTQQQHANAHVNQQQQQQQQLQEMHAQVAVSNSEVSGAKIAELQSLVGEWRKRRDAAQMIFMQENGAVERLQKTLEQMNARIARKKKLLAQHLPPAGDASNVSNNAGSASIISNNNDTHLAPPRRDEAMQCDGAIVSAVHFAGQLDSAHRENLVALQQLRSSVLDTAVQKNVQLAQEVATLVNKVQIVQEELEQQVERIRREHQATAPAQVAAAERLVASMNLNSDPAAAAAANQSVVSSSSPGGGVDVSIVSAVAGALGSGGGGDLEPEAVYRTVEKARLALAQALVGQ